MPCAVCGFGLDQRLPLVKRISTYVLPPRTTAVLGALAGAIVASACGAVSDLRGHGPLTATVHDEAGVPVLVLSHSLNEIAERDGGVATLAPDLELGGAESDVLHVTDVAAFPDGRFVVLDKLSVAVRLYAPDGTLLKVLGRKGHGPLEFQRPRAIAVVGGRLVVWDEASSKLFTVFDTAGTVIATAARTFAGDWLAMSLRGVRHSYDPPGREPMEDLTRRIGGLGSDHFLFQVQPDEVRAGARGEAFPLDGPPVHLIRFDLSGGIVDTVAEFVGPPLIPQRVLTPIPRGAWPKYDQPIFAPRPVWAGSDDWLAVASGDANSIDVRDLSGGTILRVEWPRDERGITEADRFRFADVLMQEEIDKAGGPSTQAQFITKEAREEARKKIVYDLWPFSEVRPQITAAFATGACLWLAGFHPADAPNGEALTWVGVNVEKRSLETVFRIPRNAATVRDISYSGVYVRYLDAEGVTRMERYPLPEVDCT